jgi:hypothetical protein
MHTVLANSPFADFRWTLNQALIWIATREPTLVNEASSRAALAGARTQLAQNAPMGRRTWMSTRIMALLSDDDEPTPFLIPYGAAETALWEALCRGAIDARVDEDVIPAWWFADAILQNCDPDRMVFLRRRDKPLILATHPDGSALASSRQREEPRFDVAQVMAAFPPINIHARTVVSENTTEQGAPWSDPSRSDPLEVTPREIPVLPKRGPVTKQEVQDAYRERVALYEGKRAPSREDDEKFLRDRFPGLGGIRGRARKLRSDLAPHWSRPGPRGTGKSGENSGE